MSEVLYSFGNNVLGFNSVYLGSTSYVPPTPPSDHPWIKFKFSDSAYDPTQETGWHEDTVWTRISNDPNVWLFVNEHNTVSSAFRNRFQETTNLVEVLEGNLREANDASDMFDGCTALTAVNSLYFGFTGFAQHTFRGCTNLVTADVSGTGSLTMLASFFEKCSSLVNAPNLDLSGVTVSHGLQYMFYDCTSLRTVPNYTLGNVATSLMGFFENCSSLTSENIPAFNTENITSMQHTFSGCTGLTTPANWSTGNVTRMELIYNGCRNLSVFPRFDTSKVVDFSSTFTGCDNISDSIPDYDTHNMTNVSMAFSGCRKVTGGALSLYNKLSTQAVPPTTYFSCFYACGRNTTTGAEELAQIPTSWGGTMTET
jgi:surface protein